jgi:hypothetical protein
MHQRGMASNCETLRLGRMAPRQQVVAIGLIKFSLLSVAGLSLHSYGSSAMHQRGMASSCETLRLGRLAPQQQVVAIGLIKSLRRAVRPLTTNRRQDVMLANAAAAIRPQHTHPGVSMCIR